MSSSYLPPIQVAGKQASLIRAELKRSPSEKELAIVQRATSNRLPRRKRNWHSDMHAEVAAAAEGKGLN